jgi:uncharacterized coiled-coil protein SlyX
VITLEELKRQIAEKKQAIASIRERMKFDTDKYTKIDELLIEQIEEQELTNRLLVLNNRILFLLLKAQYGGGEAPAIEGIEDIFGSRYRSRVLRVDNIKFSLIDRKEKVFALEGSGMISEIELISPNTSVNNKDYSVRIIADDNIIYNGTWESFESRTMHEADMTAFDDTNNSKYVLLFQDIMYDSICTLEIYDAHYSAELEYVNVKYHEKISGL